MARSLGLCPTGSGSLPLRVREAVAPVNLQHRIVLSLFFLSYAQELEAAMFEVGALTQGLALPFVQ